MVLLLYSTHKLQLFNIGLFSFFAIAYFVKIDKIIAESSGFTTITKGLFFKVSKSAFDEVFTEMNILHAFEKPGIWPIDRSKLIPIVTRKKTIQAEKAINIIRTPTNTRAIRAAEKLATQNLSIEYISKLLKSLHIATTRADIAEHVNQSLLQALITEKERRKRGGKLDLSGEPNTGTTI